MKENYNFTPITEEEYLSLFEEDTITVDEDWDDEDNIANLKYKEKMVRRYISSFNSYKI